MGQGGKSNMKKIIIIGGGYAGLIMAEVLSANGMDYTIYEQKEEACTKSVESVYYFHDDNIKKILSIPLKKVIVEKHLSYIGGIFYRKPDLKMVLDKCSKNDIFANSSFEECGASSIGYIEDYGLNLFKILSNRHSINFGSLYNPKTFSGDNDIIINTTPLNEICGNLGIKCDDFGPKILRNVMKLTFDKINFDKIFVIYGNVNNYFERIIIKGNSIIIESEEPIVNYHEILKFLSMDKCGIVDQKVGTIVRFNKMDDVVRKNLIFKLTSEERIYSLGRLATWSYKRIDHIVEDAFDVMKMIRFSQMGRF
jgi:hypothetical protein